MKLLPMEWDNPEDYISMAEEIEKQAEQIPDDWPQYAQLLSCAATYRQTAIQIKIWQVLSTMVTLSYK